MKVLAAILVLFSTQVFAQESGTFRYVKYPRNQQNCVLYDSTLTYSFYNIACQRVDKLVDGQGNWGGFLDGALSKANVSRLRAHYNGNVPGLEWRLAPYPSRPLRSLIDGTDSLFYEPDGNSYFVYAKRDTFFFIRGGFDDIVIQEVYNTAGDTAYWKPHAVFLRKVLFPGEEPQVVATFDWERMYLYHCYEHYVELPRAQVELLSDSLERFLAEGAKRFGGEGAYGSVSRLVREESTLGSPELSDLPDKSNIREEWRALQAMGEQNGVYSEPVTHYRRLKTITGEDSSRIDPETNEEIRVFDSYPDTVLLVKRCIDAMYGHTIIYNEYERGWKVVVDRILVTKQVPGRSKQFIVYSRSADKWIEYLPEEEPKYDYYNYQNPLRNYILNLPEHFIPRFEWQDLEKPGVFDGVVISGL